MTTSSWQNSNLNLLQSIKMQQDLSDVNIAHLHDDVVLQQLPECFGFFFYPLSRLLEHMPLII